MECKYGDYITSDSSFAWELIDTLWNVNTVKVTNKDGLKVELIDTLWNVNFRFLFS